MIREIRQFLLTCDACPEKTILESIANTSYPEIPAGWGTLTYAKEGLCAGVEHNSTVRFCAKCVLENKHETWLQRVGQEMLLLRVEFHKTV